MKRIAGSALVLVLASCASEGTPIVVDPNADPDAGAPVDDAGNAVEPDSSVPPATSTLAAGLAISDIAVFQGVKVTLVKGGKSTTHKAPVVAGREALVRVYATPDSTYKQHPITAYLTVSGSAGILARKDTKSVGATWSETSSASVFEFSVPSENMTTDAQFSVKLVDPNGGGPTSGPGQYPSDGSMAPLDAKSSGAQLKLWYFPVITNNVTPPSDASLIVGIKNRLYELYPVAAVDVTVKSSVTYTGTAPAANGSGWGQMLNWFMQKRASDKPPNDVYYYGAFTPVSSFATFCGNGCVAGLSPLAQSATDVASRVSIGLGYGGQFGAETAFTLAHEVGHAHGRAHAPCGPVQQIDPSFPYSGGTLGAWGYGLITHTFIDPAKGHDLMGYCPDNEWISDYTFAALFDRIKAVNGADVHYEPWELEPREYAWVDVAADGALSWGENVTIAAPVHGEEHKVAYLASSGALLNTVVGQYFPYNHLPGGYMLVPAAPLGAAKAKVSDLAKAPIALR